MVKGAITPLLIYGNESVIVYVVEAKKTLVRYRHSVLSDVVTVSVMETIWDKPTKKIWPQHGNESDILRQCYSMADWQSMHSQVYFAKEATSGTVSQVGAGNCFADPDTTHLDKIYTIRVQQSLYGYFTKLPETSRLVVQKLEAWLRLHRILC